MKPLDEVVVVSELAEASGYTSDNIRRLTPELIKAGLARKAGKSTLFLKTKTLQWFKDRPETRGRKKQPGRRNAGALTGGFGLI